MPVFGEKIVVQVQDSSTGKVRQQILDALEVIEPAARTSLLAIEAEEATRGARPEFAFLGALVLFVLIRIF